MSLESCRRNTLKRRIGRPSGCRWGGRARRVSLLQGAGFRVRRSLERGRGGVLPPHQDSCARPPRSGNSGSSAARATLEVHERAWGCGPGVCAALLENLERGVRDCIMILPGFHFLFPPYASKSRLSTFLTSTRPERPQWPFKFFLRGRSSHKPPALTLSDLLLEGFLRPEVPEHSLDRRVGGHAAWIAATVSFF